MQVIRIINASITEWPEAAKLPNIFVTFDALLSLKTIIPVYLGRICNRTKVRAIIQQV